MRTLFAAAILLAIQPEPTKPALEWTRSFDSAVQNVASDPTSHCFAIVAADQIHLLDAAGTEQWTADVLESIPGMPYEIAVAPRCDSAALWVGSSSRLQIIGRDRSERRLVPLVDRPAEQRGLH